MSNPTSNYSFQMPTSTDLVTDLPADFEVFGQAVDTQMKTNADAATQKSTLTTKGDIYAATAASTPARLAVGTNDQVLVADSTTATGLKWATPTAAGKNYTAVNAGGTALTGATSITVSGISAKDDIQVLIVDASSANASSFFSFTFNSDTTAKYNYAGMYGVSESTEANFDFGNGENTIGGTSYPFGRMSQSATSRIDGGLRISGANSSGVKVISATNGVVSQNQIQARVYATQGWYSGTSAISSITITSSTGNFDGGTIYVFASA